MRNILADGTGREVAPGFSACFTCWRIRRAGAVAGLWPGAAEKQAWGASRWPWAPRPVAHASGPQLPQRYREDGCAGSGENAAGSHVPSWSLCPLPP